LVEKIGEGGMGVVWRALDTTLDREVAIKILPEAFATDTERLARFEREAKLLAALDHPNIASVFGLHESEGVRFLAMELVPGEDLEHLLGRGAIPPDEAVEIGQQVAAALEAAHESGVVHRDLKPANVRIAPDGRARVLDFGLAKAVEVGPASGHSPALSPTVTSAGTMAGVILGTAAYMSPEQARGKPVDRRTDVWSFGCLLYELLTGRQAFGGETVTDVLASIVQREPDWGTLPPATHAGIGRLLQRCLRKDPRERLRDMGDVGLMLGESMPASPSETQGPAKRGGMLWPALAVLLATALVVVWATGRLGTKGDQAGENRAPAVTAMTRLTDLPGLQDSPSLSPDGRQLLYVSKDDGDEDIFLQRVGGENPVNLTRDHSGDDFNPAFSPDGERIAFCSDRDGAGIFVMGATGESPRRVSDQGFHPAWSPDGTRLVYTTERVVDPYGRATVAKLWVVDVETLDRTLLFEGDAVEPRWSPNGERIAYWTYWFKIQGQREILTIPAAGGESVAVTNDVHTDWGPVWAPDGRWLYFLSDRGGSPDLWRVRIDESSGEVLGRPQAVTTGVSRVMQASISGDGGRIALTAGRESGAIASVGFDPVEERVVGQPVTILASADPVTQVDLSRDGEWLAYRTTAPREHLYVMRVDGTARRRLTDDVHRNRGPKWSPDGRWIAFYSNRSGSYELWAIRPDGTGLRALTDAPELDINEPVWSPDGRRIVASLIAESGRRGGVLEIGEDGVDALDGPLDFAYLPGKADFSVESWSDDGRFLGGLDNDPSTGFAVTLYSFESETTEIPRDADGKTLNSRFASGRWLDSRRFALWDRNRDSAVVWDVERREVRQLTGVPGPAEMRFTRDGRTAILVTETSEFDVWLLTLEQ
jgi:Tol biopolymer transport system component